MGLSLGASRRKWVELGLVVPATVLLGPALLFGICFMFFVIGVGLVIPAQSLAARLHSSAPLIPFLLLMLGAAAGLVSLWMILLFGREREYWKSTHRWTVIVGLVSGIAAAVYWLRLVGMNGDAAILSRCLWFLLIGGPLVVSLEYVYVLLR